MKKPDKLQQIDIEQADALAQLGVDLYCKRVTDTIRWDADAFTILPSQMNKIRTDKRQMPLTFFAEVDG